MHSIPYPLDFVIIFLNMKLSILFGPSIAKLHFKLCYIWFFYKNTEEFGHICIPFYSVLLILFMKICGDALFITLIPNFLL
jgi:hypothetical protein